MRGSRTASSCVDILAIHFILPRYLLRENELLRKAMNIPAYQWCGKGRLDWIYTTLDHCLLLIVELLLIFLNKLAIQYRHTKQGVLQGVQSELVR